MQQLANGRFLPVPLKILKLVCLKYFCGRCGAILDKVPDPTGGKKYKVFRCPACHLDHFQNPEWGFMSLGVFQPEFAISAGVKPVFPKGEKLICLHQHCNTEIINGICPKCHTPYSGNIAGTFSAVARINPNDPRGYTIIG